MKKRLELSRRGFMGGVVTAAAVPLLGTKSLAFEAKASTAVLAQSGFGGLPRFQHAASTLPDGRVLVSGGYHLSEQAREGVEVALPSPSVQIFDPNLGQWSDCAPMQTPRAHHASTVLPDGRIAVSGGVFTAVLDSVEIYDPATNAWSYGTPLPQPLAGHTACAVGDQVVLIGGPAGTLTQVTRFVGAALSRP